MTKYLFAYHGGGMPETEADQARVMEAWSTWLGGIGEALVDQGNPISQTKTIGRDGAVTVGGGADPLTGYSLVSAGSIDEAVGIAKGCPIFDDGGFVTVAETVAM